MSFVSYAQNFEDVMLWRALKDIKNGFYIDIGAQDPVVDSVSLAFYEHGWRGVHVEPTSRYSNELRLARPEEYVEQVAIGDFNGVLTFYEFPDTGLSTADIEIANRHKKAGFHAVQTEVKVIPLQQLLNTYEPKEIHWLKIDVEGLEKSVLQSWNNSTVRPWILIVESTKPLTQELSHEEWESIVLDKEYEFAYFDGLNRFYVHRKHQNLVKHFAVPPNIFDGFVLNGTATQPFYQKLATTIRQNKVRAQEMEEKIEKIEEKLKSTEIELSSVYESWSWRLTKSLRVAKMTLLKLTSKISQGTLRRTSFRGLLRKGLTFLDGHPSLKQRVLMQVRRFPRLERKLRSLLASPAMRFQLEDELSSSARVFQRELKRGSVLNGSINFVDDNPASIMTALALKVESSSEAVKLGQSHSRSNFGRNK